MYIVHIASELAPLAKVGGLGDVLLGLSRELCWKGHNVDIIIPRYDCMDSSQIRDLTIDYQGLLSYYNGEWVKNTVWVGWVENLKVYFIDTHHPKHFFDRGCYYGCDDDIERFLYFSRAAMEFLYKRQLNPDIINLHDWQAAACAPLYKDIYRPLGYQKPKIVYTFHNLEYQGKCAGPDINKIGLTPAKYLTKDNMQDPYNVDTVNLMKGAFIHSDFITTVSPNYAWEVKTPEGGRGLDKVLLANEDKFKGILNGIDYSYWNPEIDRYLPAHFSSREMPANKNDHITLDKKGYVKRVLRDKFMLAQQHRPIIGCIARLVPQKGIHLIQHALNYAVEHGGQFVLLGTSPIQSISTHFHDLKHQYSDHPHVHLVLHHQEELAHLIYAASDMFIVPSLFEPCGLTQMISLKYGSIPVVRRTGGLADTIVDVDFSGKPFNETNGYAFDSPDPKGMNSALDRALDCWFHDPDRWRKLMINGMNVDFSWNKPAGLYIEVYKKVVGLEK